jgi:hypothetical protein
MKRAVTIFGDVHPAGGGWYLNGPLEVTAADGSEIVISIVDSVFSMSITTEGPDDADAAVEDGSFSVWVNEVVYGHLPTLQCVLDALGLHLGARLDPEIKGGHVSGVGVTGAVTRMPAFGTEDEPAVSGDILGRTALTGLQNEFLQSALADMRHALRFDSDSPFFCYRALDSLRGHFASTTDTSSNKASWERLRSELGIDRGEIMELKKFADSRRHGGAGTALHADHLKWALWTRVIVGRFIEKYGTTDPPSLT